MSGYRIEYTRLSELDVHNMMALRDAGLEGWRYCLTERDGSVVLYRKVADFLESEEAQCDAGYKHPGEGWLDKYFVWHINRRIES